MDRRVGRAMDDADWALLQARGRAPLLYAVLTTGIVCRAGCPARAPLRGNARAVGSVAQAVAAGFRPCKRCRPQA